MIADQKLRNFSRILRMSEKLESEEDVNYDYQENIIIQSQIMNENVSEDVQFRSLFKEIIVACKVIKWVDSLDRLVYV